MSAIALADDGSLLPARVRYVAGDPAFLDMLKSESNLPPGIATAIAAFYQSPA